MESRRQKLVRFITGSRAELQYGLIEVKALDMIVDQWLTRLRSIPDEHLDACYQSAMDSHSTRSPLLPKELLAAWATVRQGPTFRSKGEHRERTCKWGCSAEGWITVNAAGDVLVGMSAEDQFQGRKEYLYVRPCPEHRPQGIPKADAAPHCNGEWPRLRGRPTSFVPEQKPVRVKVEGWKTPEEVAEKILPPMPEPEEDDLGW